MINCHVIKCQVIKCPYTGSGCEFDSWQCRIYVPCSLTLRLLGSLRGSLGTYGLTQKLCFKKPRTLWETLNSMLHCNPSNSSPAWHTWQTITCQFIPPIFQWHNWTHLFQISLIWFFQSFLHIYLISIQPFSRKFIISFLLSNVIHLIKSIPCLNLVSFIQETFVVFVISFLFM